MFYNSVLCSVIWVHFWVNASGRDGIKQVKGRERLAFLPHPPPISLTALIHATAVTLASVPTQHPLGTLLFSATPPPPRQDLPSHFFRLSSNAAIPFTAFPYRPRYVKWYYLVPFACCKTPYFCFTLPHTIRFTFRHLLTVCLPPLQSKTPKDRGFPSIHCCSPSTCDYNTP